MRKHARAALAATGLALAMNAAPTTGAQADHCQPILIFSGVYAEAANRGQVLNPGAAGCLNDDEATNLNLLVPGATGLRVGSFPTPVEAWVDVDGVITPLKMELNSAGTRWDSQYVPILNPQRATATVKTITGFTVTVTYTATPQASL